MEASSSTSYQGQHEGSSKRGGKYGAACVGCRKRKQRCDLRVPVCSRCERLKEECVYESSVRSQLSSSQLIPTIKATFQFLQHLTTLDGHDPSVDIPQLTRAFLQGIQIPSFIDMQSPESTSEPPVPPQDIEDLVDQKELRPMPDQDKLEDTREAEVDELLMHMSLAEDGQNAHFGVTSFVWQTPSPSIVENLQRRAARVNRDTSRHAQTAEEHDEWTSINVPPREAIQGIWATEDDAPGENEDTGVLKANSEMLQSWTALAYHKLELDYGKEAAGVMMHLLQTYWCWVNPQHCILYSPIFYRDMALGGQYFNPFLLNVICATAARYSDLYLQPVPSGGDGTKTPAAVHSGAEFLAKAKMLLTVEMDKPSSIPTIQGLMLLGLGECAKGNLSQGWQYTGMSFRAMRDLGIHLDCTRLPIFGFGTMAAEDRELRRRLFWSAFTWDKIISLALGRTPTFNAWQNVSPGMIIDDTEDDADWRPVFWENDVPLDMLLYPVQKSFATSNYRQFTKLCEIVQKIIMRLYDGRPRRLRNLPFVTAMRDKLSEWFSNLPAHLKLDVGNLPEHCPPPHIFSTNALYRAAHILLYRTFLPQAWPVRLAAPPEIASEASRMCTKMAEELHALFTLYHKSFDLRNMTYTTLWSMYSAATINTVDFRSEDPVVAANATSRLVFSIHVLERGSLQSPGIRRSVQAIKDKLREPAPRRAKRSREEDAQSMAIQPPTAPGSVDNGLIIPSEWEQIFRSLQTPVEAADPSSIFNMDVNAMTQPGMDSNADLLQSMWAMPSSQNALEPQPWGSWSSTEWMS